MDLSTFSCFSVLRRNFWELLKHWTFERLILIFKGMSLIIYLVMNMLCFWILSFFLCHVNCVFFLVVIKNKEQVMPYTFTSSTLVSRPQISLCFVEKFQAILINFEWFHFHIHSWWSVMEWGKFPRLIWRNSLRLSSWYGAHRDGMPIPILILLAIP